jgi:hypothetical protein
VSEPWQEPEHRWEVGWEGHTVAQRRRMARLPLALKLEWLEETQRVLQHLSRQRPSEGGATRRPDGSPP